MSLTCFDSLVGLSSKDFACFTDERPDDYNTSDSGYYLTDTDYGLTVVDQCSLAGWTLLSAALAQAIAETKTDLRAKLRERFSGGITPFRGVAGKLKSSGTTTVTKDYIGVRIRVPRQVKGAKWVFKKIYVGINATAAKQILITSNDPLFVSPDPIDITTTANQFASVATSVELPLWSYSCPDDYLEYYITIPRDAHQPLNNTFTCCGSTPGWMGYFKADGMAADDSEATGGTFTSQAYGFALDGYLTCEELDWICEAGELNGYYVSDVLARTIQFRGAAIAISALIDSIQVNPCTGYQLENLNSKRAYLNQRYADNITWIAQNMPDGVTDCFTCKPQGKLLRTKNLV